jgi:predicted XRE-type DNA-binding protein
VRAAEATIQSLRKDIALQVSKCVRRSGETQVVIARRLGIPQPTLSKIANGRVHDLSIELLLRVAIHSGLVLTLQTGRDAKEAGAFTSGLLRGKNRANKSKLANEARKSLGASGKILTAGERLEAFLQHSQLIAELHQAGRDAELKRAFQTAHTA